MEIKLFLGDKVWLVKTPYLMEKYEQDIEPQLYELIEDNGPGSKVLKNVKDNSILHYGIMEQRKFKKYQGDLFDETSN
jgi:hypothetical protein